MLKANVKAVPNSYARNLVELLQEHGVPPEKALSNSGVTLDMLSDPDGMLTFEQELQIFSNATALSPTPDLGLQLGARQHIHHHGVYGYAAQSAADIDQVIRLLPRFHKISGVYQDVELTITDAEYCLSISDDLSLPGLHRLMVEEYITAIYNALRELSEGQMGYKWVELDYPAPESGEQYPQLFQCPVRFEASYSRVAINRSWGSLRLTTWDPATNEICTQRCGEILQRIGYGPEFVSKVREALLQLPCDRRNADRVAECLHMSSRHVRRKLRETGHHFQQVLDEVRVELAKDYLTQTRLTLDDIAPLLGISETTNFRRAFKKWSGISPGEYRKTHS